MALNYVWSMHKSFLGEEEQGLREHLIKYLRTLGAFYFLFIINMTFYLFFVSHDCWYDCKRIGIIFPYSRASNENRKKGYSSAPYLPKSWGKLGKVLCSRKLYFLQDIIAVILDYMREACRASSTTRCFSFFIVYYWEASLQVGKLRCVYLCVALFFYGATGEKGRRVSP